MLHLPPDVSGADLGPRALSRPARPGTRRSGRACAGSVDLRDGVLLRCGYGTLALANDVLDRAPRITRPINDAEFEATALAAFMRPRPKDPPRLPFAGQ